MKTLQLTTFLLLILIGLQTNAQQATGLIFDDEVYNQAPRQPKFPGSKAEEQALRDRFKVNLKPYAPIPGDQGKIASCVGWAVGYSAYTIQKAFQNGWKDQKEKITENAFSALFIFNQIKAGNGCMRGARMTDAFKLLASTGEIMYKEFDKEEDCAISPNEQLIEQAKGNVIKDYMTLFATNDVDKVKIYKTKLSLAQNKPVVIGMDVRKNFKDLAKGSEYWWPELGNTTPMGGHALCVVGYDDKKEAFEVMNSWGTDWANDGFVWVKYEDYGRFVKYAFQFSLLEKENEIATNAELKGDFHFRYPTIATEDTIAFETAEVKFSEGVYTTVQPFWEIGQKFQLIAGNVREQSYLYVFSLDPDDNLNVHWPRNQELNEAFMGANETPLVTVDNVNIVVPGDELALTFEKVGTDRICVLFSDSPISEMKQKLDLVENGKGYLNDRLEMVFGDQLAEQEVIDFDENEMNFSSNCTSGKIIPLILNVTAK